MSNALRNSSARSRRAEVRRSDLRCSHRSWAWGLRQQLYDHRTCRVPTQIKLPGPGLSAGISDPRGRDRALPRSAARVTSGTNPPRDHIGGESGKRRGSMNSSVLVRRGSEPLSHARRVLRIPPNRLCESNRCPPKVASGFCAADLRPGACASGRLALRTTGRLSAMGRFAH